MPSLQDLIDQLKRGHEEAGGFRLDPDYLGSDFHVVACHDDGGVNLYDIATEEMLDDAQTHERWRRLASTDTTGRGWMLLVPEAHFERMRDLIESEWSLPGCTVLAYFPLPEGDGVEFIDLPGLPGVA